MRSEVSLDARVSVAHERFVFYILLLFVLHTFIYFPSRLQIYTNKNEKGSSLRITRPPSAPYGGTHHTHVCFFRQT